MSKDIRSPRNTQADDPLLKLLIGSAGGGIQEQERQGQREMVNATTLPSDLNGSTQQDFEALGFTFGDVVPGDDMFRQATLPAGWEREGSDHAMWSYIVDERGVRRVGVFYKAAFYDRKAHMHLERVGYSLASEHIYGDGPIAFTPRADLTDDERADLLESAKDYLRRATEYPDIYSDRAPRARAIVDALETTQS